MNIEPFRNHTAAIVEQKKWLVLADSDQAAHHFAEQLLDLGAADVLVLAATRNAAPKAIEPRYKRTDLGTDGNPGSLGHIRSCLAAFRELPEHIRAEIDAWDPDGDARVLTPFGRKTYLFTVEPFSALVGQNGNNSKIK